MRIISFLVFFLFAFPVGAIETHYVGGFAQFDTQYGVMAGSPYQAAMGLRRIRTDFRGDVGRFAYRVNLDHAGSTTSVVDAYFEFSPRSDLSVRMGRSRSPLGFEILQSPTELVFPEYGATHAFLPNRDTGVFLTYKGNTLTVNAAYLAGSSDGSSLSKNEDVSGALVCRVTSDLGETLKGSLAGSLETRARKSGDVASSLLSSYAISGGSTFFSYGTSTYAEGLFYRIVPNLVWTHGPFGGMAEAVFSQNTVRNSGKSQGLSHYAWQLTWYWTLLGEADAVYGSNAFDHEGWQWGLRLGGARMDALSFSSFADQSQTESLFVLGSAVNWYWGREAKWSLGIDEVFHTRASGQVSRETVATARLQVVY